MYSEIKTKGFLSDFINSFWKFNNDGGELLSYEILPDGHFDLIFELKMGQIQSIDLTGLWTESMSVFIPENSVLMGVRFKLLAVEYFFRKSIKTLKNGGMRFPLAFKEAEYLHFDTLEAFANSFSGRVHYVLDNFYPIDHRKWQIFNILYQTHGETSIRQLSENIGWSSRQVNRYFNDQFGVTLKTFANILKCRASYAHIANGLLYPERNYYDQAHFIKEIKRYTGVTPKVLCRNENDRFLQLSTLLQR